MNFKNISNRFRLYWQKASKKVLNYYRSFYYSGHQVFCAICGWRGQMFFNEKCPKCNAQARTRLVPYALDYFKLISANLQILHIAPNMNEYRFVKKTFKSIALYDRLDIKKRKQVNLIDDITKPKLLDKSYDLIIIWHVFEHIKDDIKAISELYRVLRPEGRLLVSVPIYPQNNMITIEDVSIKRLDYTDVHGHYDHCRSCGLDYYKRFEAIGFRTETLEVKALNSKDIVRFGLRTDHVVWCFTK
jgi:SAM-dependent methyltransferase